MTYLASSSDLCLESASRFFYITSTFSYNLVIYCIISQSSLLVSISPNCLPVIIKVKSHTREYKCNHCQSKKKTEVSKNRIAFIRSLWCMRMHISYKYFSNSNLLSISEKWLLLVNMETEPYKA